MSRIAECSGTRSHWKDLRADTDGTCLVLCQVQRCLLLAIPDRHVHNRVLEQFLHAIGCNAHF